MNPFQRAREEALATREKLIPGSATAPTKASDLLARVEEQIELAIEPVPASYPDLQNGSAVLQREQRFIYVSDEFAPWGDVFCALVAHELGHWHLDATGSNSTVTSIETLFGSDGSPAAVKVEAYGARERQELQANVYARELLLPRSLARKLISDNIGPAKAAADLGIPLDIVRQQMLDASLLPNVTSNTTPFWPASQDQQLAASAAERAANVVAGPGTGKTSTLIHRVKYLVEQQNVEPSKILVLTFTNKAAFELVERLRGAGIGGAAELWAGTFHAFGLEFLRKFHQRFNLAPDVTVADSLTSATILAAALPTLALNYYSRMDDPYDWLGPVIEGIKRLKEELISPAEYAKYVTDNPAPDDELQRRRQDVVTLYCAHEEQLLDRGIVDFVDLIGKPALALKSARGPYTELADRFDHILVDEYQDVTQAMVELLRQLARKAQSVWVVGDIRQAIHHWRGASLKSLMRFDAEFKAHADGGKIQRYAIEVNRRSSSEILALVQEVGRQHKLEATFPLDPMIASHGASGIAPKVITCARRNNVVAAVVDGVSELLAAGVSFGNQAVLCRSRSDIQQVFDGLIANEIPAIYIGDLAQRPEVKQILCLMQLLVERQPKALVGLLGIPDLAMPMSDIRHLLEAAETNIAFQRGRWISKPPDLLSDEGLSVSRNLHSLLKECRRSSNPWAFVCDMILEHKIGLPCSNDTSVRAWMVRIALWQFAQSVRNGEGGMRESTLFRFLLRHRLRQQIGDTNADRELPPEADALDGVRLLTVHGSKGLEFDAVHIAYVNAVSYGPQPPQWTPPERVIDIVPPEALGSSQVEHEIEDAVERNNLLYVAVSRAKQRLHIYQENEFGDHTLAPQLQHFPPKYEAVRYSSKAQSEPIAAAVDAFSPPEVVPFRHFDTYAICPLQYWYSQVLELKKESAVDVSVRARWCVMSALKAIATDAEVAGDPLGEAWREDDLPSEIEDPSLWNAAFSAYSRGHDLVRSFQVKGGQFAEPVTIVGGISVQLPWGFVLSDKRTTEFALVRFNRRRASAISTILKPMASGLDLPGTKKISLNYVMSDKVDTVLGAKRPDMTKSFKAAARMISGNNSPQAGRHCNRCSYMSICPSAPKD